MFFDSFTYLLFFAIAAITFFLLPAHGPARKIFMITISYFFYGFFKWEYAFLLLFVTLITYLGGLLIWLSHGENRQQRNVDGSDSAPLKAWEQSLSAYVPSSVGILTIMLAVIAALPLLVYKYFDFLSLSYNSLALQMGFTSEPFLLNLILPLGISFFTIQGIGYVLDIYAHRFAPERSVVKFTLFLSFYPQLVAGPIERAVNIMPQLKLDAGFEFDRVLRGLQLVLLGLFLKLYVADQTANLIDPAYADPELFSGLDLFLAALYFNWQIYADFMAYSIIAIGTARVFGVTLMENFKEPWLAGNTADFWRRWHISLSTWVRDYLHTPIIMRNRHWGEGAVYLATFVTFIVIGFWHGAGWKFFLLGLCHAVLVLIAGKTLRARDKFWKRFKLLPVIKIVRLFTAFIIIGLTLVFFRADSVQDAFTIFGRIFTWAPAVGNKPPTLDFLKPGAYVFLCLIAYDLLRRSGWDMHHKPAIMKWVWAAFSSGIVLYLLMQGLGQDKPFIYYQF